METHQGSERIRELDGLRGLAIALVLVWHYLPCQLPADGGIISSVLRRGLYLTGSGVDLFFVLSGFLIFGILLDRARSKNLLKVFYLRRACRIFPVYFLTLGIYLVLSLAGGFPSPAWEWMFGNPLPFWSYALFVQNILMGIEGTFGPGFLSITWSLAIEEQFYLFAPLMASLLGRRGLAVALPALLIAAPLLRWASPGFHAYVNTPWRMDPLLAGGCLALLVRTRWFEPWLAARRKGLLVAAGALLAVIPLLVMKPGVLGILDITWLAFLYSVTVLMARYSLFPLLNTPIRIPCLLWLGQHSYAIYMFHQGVAGVLHAVARGQAPQLRDGTDALLTLTSLALTMVLAWLSMRFMEMPFLRAGQRHLYQQHRDDNTA